MAGTTAQQQPAGRGKRKTDAIAQVPVGDGSGFQWVAVMPLGLIFLLLTLPALVLSWDGRDLWLGLALGTTGLVAFALLWRQLLDEF